MQHLGISLNTWRETRSWSTLCTRLRELHCPLVSLRIDHLASNEYAQWESGTTFLLLEDQGLELDTVLTNFCGLEQVDFLLLVPGAYEDNGALLGSIWARMPRAHKRSVRITATLERWHRHSTESKLDEAPRSGEYVCVNQHM